MDNDGMSNLDDVSSERSNEKDPGEGDYIPE
jgi:hypothetical protein